MSTEAELEASRKTARALLSPEELAAMDDELSEDEKAALAKVAEGADDDDDDDDDDAAAAADAAAAPVVADATVPGLADGDDGQAAAAADGAAAAEEPQPAFKPRFVVELPPDLDDKIAGLVGQEDALAQKMKDGEIEISEFLQQQRAVSAERAALEAKREQAATFEELNRQNDEQEWMFRVQKFKATALKVDGVDYLGTPALDEDLDTFVKALAKKPENANKDFDFFLTEAHKRVKALHGIAPKVPPAGDKPAKRKAPDAGTLPATLAAVPGSDGPGDAGNEEFADLDKLEGMEYEMALAKMPKEQRDRYLAAA